MARVWEHSADPPLPAALGPAPPPGVAAVIAPHDDYVYAGRVYRAVLPLVTAPTVVIIGVFHGYLRAGVRGVLVFDDHARWGAPDGDVPVDAGLRAGLLGRLPAADARVDRALHDGEHSVEALVYWLRHGRPDRAIVPLLVAGAGFDRLEELAQRFARALAAGLAERGLRLGEDAALVVSADAIHYGPDFGQVRFGPGGDEAHRRACELDRGLLAGPLAGAVTREKARALFGTFVEPEDPDRYRWTWCGRFTVPFALLALAELARAVGGGEGGAIAHPVAYQTSLSAPPLAVGADGPGVTAPAHPGHFVGYPAVAFTLAAGATDRGPAGARAPDPPASPPRRGAG